MVAITRLDETHRTTDDARAYVAAPARPPGDGRINPVWERLATRVQPKLEVSAPDDADEREADAAANAVAGAPSTGLPTLGPASSQHTPVAPLGADVVPEAPGRPLDAQTRHLMESRFGHPFDDVRIHTEPTATAVALNARAYTTGRDIVFGERQYAPSSAAGRSLIAHELAHVVQQRNGGGTSRLQRQVAGPPVATAAGADFDMFLLQLEALETAAIADGYGFNDRVTAFRKIFYDSASSATTYAGAVVGGGVWNILIPGAAGVRFPPSWSTTGLDGAVRYLRSHQSLTIAGRSVDIGHLFAGADAARHPTSVSLAGGTVSLRSNVEASTFIGDLGSVVTEYIHGSTASFRDTAMVRSSLLDSYYDGSHAMASASDMAGNADAYALTLDPAKTVRQNLLDYYTAATGGAKKRYTTFATAIGLGSLTGSTFSGDTTTWRNTMTEQVFNSALAYAGGKGWRADVINVLSDPGPGVFTPTFWEMYWNNSQWVVDIFVDRMKREVARE